MLLECGNCKERETVEHSDVESDVFLINEGIVRYCKQCGDSTLWKRASEAPAPEEQPVLVGAGPVASASSSAEATSIGTTPAARIPQASPTAQASSILQAFSKRPEFLGVCFARRAEAGSPPGQPSQASSHQGQLQGFYSPLGFSRRHCHLRRHVQRRPVLQEP